MKKVGSEKGKTIDIYKLDQPLQKKHLFQKTHPETGGSPEKKRNNCRV